MYIFIFLFINVNIDEEKMYLKYILQILTTYLTTRISYVFRRFACFYGLRFDCVKFICYLFGGIQCVLVFH